MIPRLIALCTLVFSLSCPLAAEETHPPAAMHAPAAHAETPPAHGAAPSAEAPATHAPAPPSTEAPAVPDDSGVRILIDTSGSMKQTDPHNLRLPALKLLVNLLPAGINAGVWTFDSAARNLVPVGKVDAAWKASAVAATSKVHSKGAFTHIEAGLQAASEGWNGAPAPGGFRSLILLTDGQVDVSKNPDESRQSRQRLLDQLVPALQQASVQVHTIALSDHADHELMRQIAMATGGWNEVIRDAEQLKRTFLTMFDKAAPPDTVPLDNNRFQVDTSIEEFTVLVLLKPDAKPTQLKAPDGVLLEQGKLPATVRWVHEAGHYDLVTVQKPTPGEWQLLGDIDPANRVMIVTHLQMDVTQPPNFLTPGEIPDIHATFSENGEVIRREEFLSLIKLDATISGNGETRPLTMPRDLENPERFLLTVPEHLPAGDYKVTLTADGKTFRRQTNLSFKMIAERLRREWVQTGEASEVIVTLVDPGLKPDQVHLQVKLTDQTGASRELEAHADGQTWHFALNKPAAGEHWVVNFTATAPDGDLPLKPLDIRGADAPAGHESPAQPAHSPESAAPPEHAEQPLPAPNWWLTVVLAVAVNAVVGVAAWMFHRTFKKRTSAAMQALLKKLDGESA